MKQEFAPRTLNVAAFAANNESHTGDERLAQFGRLMEESQGLGGETLVAYSLQGSLQSDAAGKDEPWLHLAASATLSMVCQRCLGPVDVPVAFGRDFRFVATEELAEVEDEESKSFNLLDLMEDELLMAMPPVPKHEICPKPVKLQATDAAFEETPSEKPNPFAVLQQLKNKDVG
jgi:uncharacterized protein